MVGSVLGASARPTEDDVVLPAAVDLVEQVPDQGTENAAEDKLQPAALVEDIQPTPRHPFRQDID